ncbi:probable protein phosphatase 2C 21 isoform X2 [Phragmites australis]|uniref:probable protein phosphatase 2C 21 isoform X2 n=1 Tax=Phragmites australis TaxID=29695 RepID=UPI002D789FA5|nr:probable protein phosphatase 2C 21 isoform X2 [Phragmites australis]
MQIAQPLFRFATEEQQQNFSGKHSPAMGASNSRPVTSKFTDGGETDRINYAVSSVQGRCEKMEDACAAVPDLDGTKSTSFFGVYDGHGGAEVALYCARQFHNELVNDPNYQNNPANAMRSVFFRMDDLIQQSNEWRELVNPRGDGGFIPCLKTGVCANVWPFNQEQAPEGSTACVVLIKDNQIIVGNAGDSRCVLSSNGQATDLSTDHKPNRSYESPRIERAGGHIVENKLRGLGWVALNGHLLPISRAIGDSIFKQNENFPPEKQMVTCNPDIRTVDIDDNTKFLVIASDGIWNILSSQLVVNHVHRCLRSGQTDLCVICEELIGRCLPSNDNMTVILVQFKSVAGNPHPNPSVNTQGTDAEIEDSNDDIQIQGP